MWENIDFITEVISNSFNKTDTLTRLGLKNNGGNYNTLTSFILINKIDISHFTPKKSSKKKRHLPSLHIDLVLVKNSPYKSTNHLKSRLYREGLKIPICEICSQGENWMGKKMSLILDHINGDRNDNRLLNLRIVCPNCNATLDTHCRGLNPKYDPYDKCSCGGQKKKESQICISCFKKGLFVRKNKKKEFSKSEKNKSFLRFDKRIVERPPYEQLIEEVKELGYRGTGKKYNVSDNSVRKWIKMYEKYGENF